jgi:hypothetical protein
VIAKSHDPFWKFHCVSAQFLDRKRQCPIVGENQINWDGDEIATRGINPAAL